MADLKLPKLPDRTPVKLTLTLPPNLARELGDYQAIYNERRSADEPLADLAVYMLAEFMAGDREFARARAARSKT